MSVLKIKYSFIICSFIFFIGCSTSLNYKEVEIIIEEEHPFEKAIGTKVWYSLCYTDSSGKINYIHLKPEQRIIKIWIKKNITVFFCARILDDYSPIGGVINPGNDNRVILNYKNGYLVSFLQDLYIQNPKAVCSINYERVYDLLEKRGILFSFDKLTFARALLNGNLNENSIYELSNIPIEVNQAIEGYWISENPDEGGFLISDSNYKRVKLSLGEGEHNYINFEKGFRMKIIVDTRSKKYFVKIEEVNEELT
ncbi:MAG: hypothetical protein EOL97_03260 [Spirochaetia bacterium]|nr:hypothetical protein [Spirochaetia bacterium]